MAYPYRNPRERWGQFDELKPAPDIEWDKLPRSEPLPQGEGVFSLATRDPLTGAVRTYIPPSGVGRTASSVIQGLEAEQRGPVFGGMGRGVVPNIFGGTAATSRPDYAAIRRETTRQMYDDMRLRARAVGTGPAARRAKAEIEAREAAPALAAAAAAKEKADREFELEKIRTARVVPAQVKAAADVATTGMTTKSSEQIAKEEAESKRYVADQVLAGTRLDNKTKADIAATQDATRKLEIEASKFGKLTPEQQADMTVLKSRHEIISALVQVSEDVTDAAVRRQLAGLMSEQSDAIKGIQAKFAENKTEATAAGAEAGKVPAPAPINNPNIPDDEEARFQSALDAEQQFMQLESPTPAQRANYERAKAYKSSYMAKYKQWLNGE